MDGDASDVSGATSDCASTTLCSEGCSPFMVGNGVCDTNCTAAGCGFDGGDCGQFCDTDQNCPISWVNNGACDVACFEASTCERDGRDCNFSPRCSRGCVDYVMLANGRCEPACNTTECGYDYGDCGADVPASFVGQSCFPGFVFDCDVTCVAVTGIRDGTCNNAASTNGNFDCAAFYNDFGDCPIQTCTSEAVPSVLDCDSSCAPISQVGDSTCNDGASTAAEACVDSDSSGDDCSGFTPGDATSCGACDYTAPATGNFNCEEFFFDFGDCVQPIHPVVEAALELGFSVNESAAIMDTSSPARQAFETNFVFDLGRSLGVPTGSVQISGISRISGTGRRRAQQDQDDAFTPGVPLVDLFHDAMHRVLQDRGRGRNDPVVPEVVTLVVEFEIQFDDLIAARAVVQDIAVQAADPNSPLRTSNTTAAVTRADTVRLNEPVSWVADLITATVAASCEGQQVMLTLNYGNVAWALQRWNETVPMQSGSSDLLDETFCVPEGAYSLTLQPANDAQCCSGDWSIKIKDTTTVLADGFDFQHFTRDIFVVGSSADVQPVTCETPPCGEGPDVHSMAGFTCLPLWLSAGIDANGAPRPALRQGCAPHPTLGETVGVGWCKVQRPASTAYSGCNNPSAGSGCGEFYWDFCGVDGGLAFQVAEVNQGEVIAEIDGGEFEYFLFDAFAGAPYTMFTIGYGLSDTVMYLYDTDGVTQLEYNDDFNGLMSQISWSCPTTGTYVIGVRGYSPSQTGGFGLQVDVVVPPNPCDPNPCLNSGVCHDLTYTFSCTCPPEYVGTTCNIPNMAGQTFVEVAMCPAASAHSISDIGLLSDDLADYANNADCGLHIETAAGTAVQLTFTSFALETNFDYVYVYDGDSSSATQLARFTGYDIPLAVATLGGNHMFVRMTSDGSVINAGFEAIWSTLDPTALPPPPPPDPCSGGIQLVGGGDVDFTGGYNDGMSCQWTLTCAGTMTLDFTAFSTEANFDFVTVNDGPDNASPVLYFGSGSYTGGQLVSTGGTLRIEFTSDGSVVGEGFFANFQCGALADPCDGQGGLSLSDGFNIDFAGTAAAGTQCLWQLSCPASEVTLNALSVDAGQTLQLFEGMSVTDPQIGTGLTVPGSVSSVGNTMLLSASSGAAFMASFSCVTPAPPPDPCAPGGTLVVGGGNIDFTGGYANSASCSWYIQCDSGPVSLTFTSFDTEGCCDNLSIDENDVTAGQGTLGYLQGSALPADVVSSGSSMYLAFFSDGSVTLDGFSAVATCPGGGVPVDPCVGTHTIHGSAAISFVGGYDDNLNCNWNIICPAGPVVVTFQSFSTEAGYDYVYVDGAAYDGTAAPGPVTSQMSSTAIQFTSDGSVGADGFSAVIDCPVPVDPGVGTGSMDACNAGATLHGNTDIDFTMLAGAPATCNWDLNCVTAPVVIQFEFFATEDDVDIATVYEGNTNIAVLGGQLPFGTVPAAPWVQSSTGNTLGLEMITTGLYDADFRATVSCPNDVHQPGGNDSCMADDGVTSWANDNYCDAPTESGFCDAGTDCSDCPNDPLCAGGSGDGGGGAPTLIEIELMCSVEYLACQSDAACPAELDAALLLDGTPPMTGSPAYVATVTCVMAQLTAGEVCGTKMQTCFENPSCAAILNAPVTDMAACQADVDCDAFMTCEFSNSFGPCLDPASGPMCTMADIGTFMSMDENTDPAVMMAAMATMSPGCLPCIDGLSGGGGGCTADQECSMDGSLICDVGSGMCIDGTGGGRRRQQVTAANTTERVRDIISDANKDAFLFDDDRCLALGGFEVPACDEIQAAWEATAYNVEDRDSGDLKDKCDANSACQYLAGQKAFVFLIPLDFSEQTVELNITSLMDYLWVDQKTR